MNHFTLSGNFLQSATAQIGHWGARGMASPTKVQELEPHLH